MIRRLLARRGFQMRRIVTPLYDLDDFVANEMAAEAGRAPLEIQVFDSEPRIQRGLLRALGATPVRFHGLPDVSSIPAAAASSGRTWVFVGGAWNRPTLADALRPLIGAADCLLYRLDPADAAALGFPEAVALAEHAGLALDDIITSLQPVPFNAPANRHFLLFRRLARDQKSGAEGRDSIQRIDEARAFLSRPLARSADFRLLTGRGTLGFAAGLFNPGATELGGRRILVLRAERVPWAIQEGSERVHLQNSAAVAGCLADDGTLADTADLVLQGNLDPAQTRTEDYRLFSYRGRCLCSHSLITPPAGQSARDLPLRLEDLDTRVAVSELDYAKRELRLVGEPQSDFKLNKTEKNWAFFASGEDLMVIYSMVPYRLLRSRDWPTLAFRTELEVKLALPFGADGRSIRNSINPVVYDERHFLHIVHKVYPNKQYVFWALLIDRQTLLPAFALDRPLVRAGASVAAAIVYACSAIAGPEAVLVFAGVDDCGSGYWRLDRKELDAHWRALAAAAPPA